MAITSGALFDVGSGHPRKEGHGATHTNRLELIDVSTFSAADVRRVIPLPRQGVNIDWLMVASTDMDTGANSDIDVILTDDSGATVLFAPGNLGQAVLAPTLLMFDNLTYADETVEPSIDLLFNTLGDTDGSIHLIVGFHA